MLTDFVRKVAEQQCRMRRIRIRALAIVTAMMLALIVAPAGLLVTAAAAPAPVTITTAFTTGYTWFDNSPPGTNICCGVVHNAAGGTGTYGDPITLAAGLVSANVLDYPRGTLFYMPDVRRYFMVEDSCGSVGTGCHVVSGHAGATTWVDRWVGGTASDSQKAVQDCADFLTDDGGTTPLHTIVENPPPGLAVVPGPLFQNGLCTAVYGNAAPASTPQPPPAVVAPPATSAPVGPAASAVPSPQSGATPASTAEPTPSSSSEPTSPRSTAVPTTASAIQLGLMAPGLLTESILILFVAFAGIAGWLVWRRLSIRS